MDAIDLSEHILTWQHTCFFQISGDFCSWLRDLPEGEDDSINNTSPEKIRTLFDSTHVAKPNTSKLVEGLRSW